MIRTTTGGSQAGPIPHLAEALQEQYHDRKYYNSNHDERNLCKNNIMLGTIRQDPCRNMAATSIEGSNSGTRSWQESIKKEIMQDQVKAGTTFCFML